MNIPGGHPPPKFWRFLALGAVNWRSCFWLGRHFAFLTKTSVAEDLSWRLRMKMKMHMQLKSTRIKMVHVDSRRHSNFSETPKMVFSLGGKWLENNLKRSWKWRCKRSFAFARTFRQSIVKSKILPIVFVEDIPVRALMPNLVQLCQIWFNFTKRHCWRSCFWLDFLEFYE